MPVQESTYGERIKKLRFSTTPHISRETLSRTAGISAMTIYKIEEQGVSPSLSTIQKIAAALSVTVGDLVD